MKLLTSLALALYLLTATIPALAQPSTKTDSLKSYDYRANDRSYIAKRTAMKSALLPGWGQFDNDQKIKIPFIYLALGATGYFITQNYTNYREASRAFIYRLDSDPNTEVEKYRYASTTYIQSDKKIYRQNLDYSVLAAVAFYTLNILDAAVFSHLQDFDVSEDLSFTPQLRIEPYLIQAQPTASVGFTLHFK